MAAPGAYQGAGGAMSNGPTDVLCAAAMLRNRLPNCSGQVLSQTFGLNGNRGHVKLPGPDYQPHCLIWCHQDSPSQP